MPLDLAIVTSCFNYGKYLQEWARSIVQQRVLPPMVCIVDNGSTDDSPRQIAAAAQLLQEAGIEVRTSRIERANFGRARNAAVELAEGREWVMHLDADDMLMPHCLADVQALAPKADVVSLGYQRCGDLKAGPKFTTKLYRDHRGAQTLKSRAPASGVSPFRRAFWERSPYREDMEGGWDTALWIGFAHLNARFVATRRPCFWYRQHADSIFNTRRVSDRKSKLVGWKLTMLRRKVAGVSVLVPWRSDGGPRDAAWAWIRRRYELLHPGWQIVTGAPPPGPWRKGSAIQDALGRATGDVLVLADADCVIAPEALEEAVALTETEPWIIPHLAVKRLDDASTRRLLAQDPATAKPGGTLSRRTYRGFAGGGMVALQRSKYEATGGLPDVFRGWGAEDEALAVILDTLLGPHTRLKHDLWHLWHPQTPRGQGYEENRGLLAVYQAQAGNPDGMWALVKGNGSRPEHLTGPEAVFRATRTWKMGTRIIRSGSTFQLTEAEARRHQVRARKLGLRLR
jgi:glycosyltransferase involved in cell wall biosynthesis